MIFPVQINYEGVATTAPSFYMYKNSQKRLYQTNGIYFITTVTKNRYPYFLDWEKGDCLDQVVAEVIFNSIFIQQQKNGFNLYEYALLSDHMHLLVKPCLGNNISSIVRDLKRNISRNLNILFGFDYFWAGEDSNHHLPKNNQDSIYGQESFQGCLSMKQYIDTHKQSYYHARPQFKWQRGFHDEIIKSRHQFKGVISYIRGNYKKHNVKPCLNKSWAGDD